jgi:predicted nuclease of restriction endonuclease-like (RecB) superfamily
MSEIQKYYNAAIEIKTAILQSRYRVARTANAEQLALYYSVGRYISYNTRTGKWGTGALKFISRQLQGELPGVRGFSVANMKYMRLFFEKWTSHLEPNCHLPSDDLASESHLLIRHLPSDELTAKDFEAFTRVGFTHHREILNKTETYEERWYYIRRCAAGFWSVVTLRERLKGDDFHRRGSLPNNFSLTIPDTTMAEKAVRSFKDEYLLDYINVNDPEDYDERDVEAEIVANIKKFIITVGDGFCFIANQYRILVEDEESFVDLLFFSRDMQCLVAVELKRGRVEPSDLGQLTYYLSALDRYAKRPHENKSVGIILCKEMNKTKVELAVQDFGKPLGIATYSIGNDIPVQYKSLIPVIDGVQQLLSENSDVEVIK